MLPKHLLLGIPDHRKISLDGRIWPVVYQGPAARWDLDSILASGVTIDDRTKTAYTSTGILEDDLDTQQIAYKFLGYLGTTPMPHIDRCNTAPPLDPNTFSDGSYLHPGQGLASATFGVWYPERECEDVTDEELEFCRQVLRAEGQQTAGVSIAGSLPGVYNSSTRAELAGSIVSFAKPGALHLALDNLSVVNGIKRILDGGKRARRPWSLRSDADLWEIAERAINAKGRNSITVTWTKGHATWRHILDGITSERNAIGNGYADAAADAGHEAVDKHDEQTVLSNIAAGQDAYVKLIFRLQRYALAIIKADKSARDENGFIPKGKTAPVQWLEIPTEIGRLDFTEGCSLDFLKIPLSVERKLEEECIFWKLTRWTTKGRPTTWLEMFALFRLWGGGQTHEPRHAYTQTFFPAKP